MIFGVGINDLSGTECCPYYKRWTSMLQRCYSLSFQTNNNESYFGCSVCSDWLVFSNFKSWMKNKDWKGKELDKDIIKDGNKLYSPDTCCFVERKVNSLLKNKTGAKGYCYISEKDKYVCTINGKYLGIYETAKEASEVTFNYKSKLLKEAANEEADIRIKNGLIIHSKLFQELACTI